MHLSRRLGSLVGLALVAGLAAFAPEALAQEIVPDSPWSIGLIASILALSLGAFSAVLGMWVTRDAERPAMFAVAMSVLILTAVGVGIVQSYLDAVEGAQKRADLARMMITIKEIAMATGDTELAALIEAEGGGTVEMPPPPEPEPVVEEGAVEGEEGAVEGAEGGVEAAQAPAEGEAATAPATNGGE